MCPTLLHLLSKLSEQGFDFTIKRSPVLKVTGPQTIVHSFNKPSCNFRATPGPMMAQTRSSLPSEEGMGQQSVKEPFEPFK